MITAPERLLTRLEWTIVRRLDGRIQGRVRTSRRGSGLDFAGLRAYVEGDDARHIDWNVTARLDEPQIREFTEDRELTTWLVVDRSASMVSGAGRSKADVSTELALVLARLLARSGNRVGAVLYDTREDAPDLRADGRRLRRQHRQHRQHRQQTSQQHGQQTSQQTSQQHGQQHGSQYRAQPSGSGQRPAQVITPGTGRNQALRIGRELDRAPRPHTSATTDLAAMLETVATLARRCLVVVVSDFIGTGAWERPLMRLAHRNEVVALQITDPADDALPAVGLIVVEDAETGEQLLVDSADPWFQDRYRDGVDRRDAGLAAGTRRAGVPLHRVGVNSDLVEVLTDLVARTRQPTARGPRR